MATNFIDRELIKNWYFSAFFWLVTAMIFGLITSIKFNYPNFLGNISWLSFGRIRVAHTNTIAFGWWGAAAMGGIMYITPMLCGRKLYYPKLAKISLYLWNIIIILEIITILGGFDVDGFRLQAIEYGEMPFIVDILFTITFLTIFLNIFRTIFSRTEKQLYVSLWYLMGGLIWASTNWVVGNILPNYFIPGAAGAALVGWYTHNTVGTLITPLSISIVYYLLPVTTKNPLYSHKLSLIGFWSIAFFYTWSGAHHYLYSPIPDWVEAIAITSSMMLIIPVWTVAQNFYGTMVGKWHLFYEEISVRFLVFGMVFYILTCLQGPLQALKFMQRVVHFTDYVIGHAHLALLGAFTFWMMSGAYYILPKIYNRTLYSKKLALIHFWLTIIGVTMFILVLTIAGLIQGHMWISGVPFIDVVRASAPYWLLRSFAGIVILTGTLCFIYNIVMTIYQKEQT